jgi:hypothetical protein
MGLELTRPVQARRESGGIVIPDSVHPLCDPYAHQQGHRSRLDFPRPAALKDGPGNRSKLGLREDGTMRRSVADRRL